MRVKAFSMCALVVALFAFVQARPAITDTVQVKFDEWKIGRASCRERVLNLV